MPCYQFVYPFSLESFVVSPPPTHLSHAQQRTQIQSDRQRRAQYLEQREAEKSRAKKEVLRRVAPGYDAAEVLQPTRQSFELPKSLTPGQSAPLDLLADK
jgi:hypothetical protein